jgi:F0F1-type ATP synthase membrane subunit a
VIVWALAAFSILANIPLGFWRKKLKKFSVSWFIAIHATVPIIIAVRLFFGISNLFIPLFIALAVAGQLIGGKVAGKSLSQK